MSSNKEKHHLHVAKFPGDRDLVVGILRGETLEVIVIQLEKEKNEHNLPVGTELRAELRVNFVGVETTEEIFLCRGKLSLCVYGT